MLSFKIKLLTFIFILSSSIITHAQFDFREGFIINNDNDSIFGLIDYKGNMANAKRCLFKENDASDAKEFTPQEIKSFKYKDSKYYVSKTVIDGKKEEQLFLEFLIDGIVDVYYFRDKYGEHYLIDKGDGKLLPLKNTEKIKYVGSKKYVRESNEYIGILKYTFSESPNIQKKVDQSSLSHKSLIKLASEYHNEVCTSGEECIVYEKQLPKYKFSFGALVGMNNLSYSTRGTIPDTEYYLKNSNFKTAPFPTFGFFLKKNFPALNERLNLQYEGTFGKSTTTTNQTYVDPVYNQTVITDLRLSQFSYNSTITFRYEFPDGNKGKLRPVFHAGMFTNVYFADDYKRDLTVKWSNGELYRELSYTDNPFKKYDLGVSFGIGLIKTMKNNKDFMADFRYQRGLGLDDNLGSSYLMLNLGIQLGK